MIRHVRWFALAAVSGALACGGAAMSGCSGDDSSGGAPDASTDTTKADSQVTPDTGGSDTSTGDDTGTADSGDAGTCMLVDAASLDDASVQAGRALVLQFGCANCHQTTPADAGLVLSGHSTTIKDGGMIFPPNLTPDPTTGLGCWSDDQITNAILNAIDDKGASLCVMPKFATKGMDAGSAEAIATFLRSLPIAQNQVPDSVCPVDAGADAADAADASGD